MYNFIVNPETGRKININSSLGQNIIKNYLYQTTHKGGSSAKNWPRGVSLDPRPQTITERIAKNKACNSTVCVGEGPEYCAKIGCNPCRGRAKGGTCTKINIVIYADNTITEKEVQEEVDRRMGPPRFVGRTAAGALRKIYPTRATVLEMEIQVRRDLALQKFANMNHLSAKVLGNFYIMFTVYKTFHEFYNLTIDPITRKIWVPEHCESGANLHIWNGPYGGHITFTYDKITNEIKNTHFTEPNGTWQIFFENHMGGGRYTGIDDWCNLIYNLTQKQVNLPQFRLGVGERAIHYSDDDLNKHMENTHTIVNQLNPGDPALFSMVANDPKKPFNGVGESPRERFRAVLYELDTVLKSRKRW